MYVNKQAVIKERDWQQTEATWRSLVEEYGFILIRLAPASKEPLEKRWGDKVWHKQFEQIGLQEDMNAGVVCGRESNLIVLDIDDPEAFHKLNLNVPETFSVRTGKGTHHYFRLPESDTPYRNRKKCSFDIRAEMGYVVAPCSVHPDGSVYELTNNMSPVDAPEWLLELSKDGETKRYPQQSSLDELKKVDIQKLGLSPSILKLITEGAPEGSDRSGKDYAVITALLKSGCDDSQIRWIFTEYPISEKSDEHPDKYHYIQTTIDAAYSRIEEDLPENEWSTVSIPDTETLKGDYRILAQSATKDLVRTLEEHDNVVSQGREEALQSLINTYSAMASGRVRGRIAFPLPTGYGKTTSVISFLSCASKMGLLDKQNAGGFSIAITAFKVEELCEINRQLMKAGVPSEFISLLHSYKHTEGIKVDEHGNVDKNYASMPATKKVDESGNETFDTSRSILLLTQNKAKNSNDFDFHDLIAKRTMVIWDESLLSTEVGTSNTKYLRTALAELEGVIFDLKIQNTPNDLLSRTERAHSCLQECFGMVLDEIISQAGGNKKKVLLFDGLSTSDTISILDEIMKRKGTSSERMNAMKAVKEFARITQHDASLELGQEEDHTLVRFDIAIPSSAQNIIILDASAWINELMRLDETISIPDNLNVNLSYEGTTIHRIPFNAGRDAIEKELISNKYNLLGVLDEILRKHAGENVLFFTFKQKTPYDPDCRDLIEKQLSDIGHDLREKVNGKPRFNWLTHGNYTASNSYAHCTVMIFVGVLHLPPAVYAAKGIAQSRDLQATPDTDKIKHSMQATDGHQGINRGACRIQKGDTALPVNAYYTYLDESLVNYLKLVMPGACFAELETDLLKPRSKQERALRALKKYLVGLNAEILKVAKVMVNKEIPEMIEISGALRKRVMKLVDNDPLIPWQTEGRSWIRTD